MIVRDIEELMSIGSTSGTASPVLSGYGNPSMANGHGNPGTASGHGNPGTANGHVNSGTTNGHGNPRPVSRHEIRSAAQERAVPGSANGHSNPRPASRHEIRSTVQGHGVPGSANGYGVSRPASRQGIPSTPRGQGIPGTARVRKGGSGRLLHRSASAQLPSQHRRDKMTEEAERLSQEKARKIVEQGSDDKRWRESIRQQMEAELDQRVRDALETPPPERYPRQLSADSCKKTTQDRSDLENLNAHVLLDLSDKERAYLKSRRWKALQAKRQMQKYMSINYVPPQNSTSTTSASSHLEVMFRDELSKSNQDEFPGVYGLTSFSEGVKDLNEIHRKQYDKYPTIRQLHKQYYTKDGFLNASRSGRFPDGTVFDQEAGSSYGDRFGVIRNEHGPFWPPDWGPLFPAPKFIWKTDSPVEPLYYFFKNQSYPTVESQLTQYVSKWRGVLIVFDSERSSRDHYPNPVPQGCCPSLLFESRFECGNLRQARRVGQFEYELVLKTDLYTNRHTQWYYFRVQNTVPGVTYRFRIVNLLKRDSLYNYGMRPLLYSEHDAKTKGVGWTRTGHHISYSRNVMHLHCPLLMRGFAFYELEFQMDFPNENDTYYLAHCYPYTFTDLKDDLESLLNDKERQNFVQREVLCETRAGNSCFLVTVTNFDQPQEVQDEKKAVILTARVHPGESQASWMMKGVLEYITGPDNEARELRDRFIFKIVPMLNPDGVIVGNYRCSLAARDLNRNYRHPRKESFPTVYHTKTMIENVSEKHEVVLYCDLHGHSRKHNVFMYGNNTSAEDQENNNGVIGARAFLNERLFPWLMSQRSPDKFSFPFCKFNIKRCKEATGRVVMWRQMKILNSFTLEATFSGTGMTKNLAADECRHFNIADFMEMGQILCQSVLEYQYTQENKSRQTEIVLEMTKYLTCQVIERRNRGTLTYKMPNLRAFMRAERANKAEEVNSGEVEEKPGSQEQAMELDNSDELTQALMETLDSVMSPHGGEPGQRRKERKMDGHTDRHLSKMQVDNILDTESIKTMDGCLKILAQLKVSEAFEESDSSDSDSESEPEMKPPAEPKVKKKKRKSKKQRDKEQQDRKGGSGGSDKKEERKFSALPTISGNATSDNRGESSTHKSQALKGERAMLNSKKDNSHFISKYEGRKNGGIPCFAEERSVERAAKRMAEMKKRSEEEKQREMAFFIKEMKEMREYLLGTGSTKPELLPPRNSGHIPMPQVEVKSYCNLDENVELPEPESHHRLPEPEPHPRLPEPEPHHRLRSLEKSDDDDDNDDSFYEMSNKTARGIVSVQSATPQPLELTDLPKSMSPVLVSRNELPSRPLPRNFSDSMKMPTIMETLAKLKPRSYHSVTLGNAYSFRDLAPSVLPANGPQQNSSSELSDSEGEPTSNLIPVTARATPFHHDSQSGMPSQVSTSHSSGLNFKKHLSLRGPAMRSVSRQMTASATSPVSYHHTNIVLPPGRGEERRISVDDRKHRTGPLGTGAQSPSDTVRLDYGHSTILLRSRTDLNLSKDYLKILMDRVRNNPLI